MQLEVGKTYIARNGTLAFVVARASREHFRAEVRPGSTALYFLEDGSLPGCGYEWQLVREARSPLAEQYITLWRRGYMFTGTHLFRSYSEGPYYCERFVCHAQSIAKALEVTA